MGIFAKNIKLSASNKIKHGHQNVLCDLNDVLISTRHEQSIFLLRIQQNIFPSPSSSRTCNIYLDIIFHLFLYFTLQHSKSNCTWTDFYHFNGLIMMSGKMPSNIIRNIQRMDNGRLNIE